MGGLPQVRSIRTSLWAWCALLCLFFAQATPAEGCESGCACAPSAQGSTGEPVHTGTTDDCTGDQCPPGCDDCLCCPGAMAAAAPHSVTLQLTGEARQELIAPPDRSTSGVSRRIYRPPKPSLV